MSERLRLRRRVEVEYVEAPTYSKPVSLHDFLIDGGFVRIKALLPDATFVGSEDDGSVRGVTTRHGISIVLPVPPDQLSRDPLDNVPPVSVENGRHGQIEIGDAFVVEVRDRDDREVVFVRPLKKQVLTGAILSSERGVLSLWRPVVGQKTPSPRDSALLRAAKMAGEAQKARQARRVEFKHGVPH